MENKDTTAHHNEGLREPIKTMYEEVEYERRVYEVIQEDGLKEYVFTLNE